MYYTPRQPLQPLHPVCGAAISDDICSYIDEIEQIACEDIPSF